MSYSSNPLLPKARAEAVRLVVEHNMSLTVAARRSGVHRSTLWRWWRKWLGVNKYVQLENSNRPTRTAGRQFRLTACKWQIPTLSSRPHTSPAALPQWVVARIAYWRMHKGRGAAVVHAHCMREGTQVSLASVKRVLKRLGFVLRPKYKRRYQAPIPRPRAVAPGSLVQTDTVHLVNPVTKQRIYLYTLIDVYSRWAYVEYHEHISQKLSYQFLQRGQARFGRPFQCVQADNGPEFGRWLKLMLNAHGTTLRHSRVRRPNDNAFIERFNRTIQEECLLRRHPKPDSINQQLFEYLAYYNEERLHSGIQYGTPLEVLQRS